MQPGAPDPEIEEIVENMKCVLEENGYDVGGETWEDIISRYSYFYFERKAQGLSLEGWFAPPYL